VGAGTFAESVTVADLEADPYPIYARLRREAPVCYVPAVGLWFVTRYDDVEYAVTHPDRFTAELDDSPVDRTFGSPTILTVDGDRHLDLRRALDTKYRPKNVNAYIDDLVRPSPGAYSTRSAAAPTLNSWRTTSSRFPC